MEENQYKEVNRDEEEFKEINLTDIFRQLLRSWKKILIWAGIAAALGFIIAVSIPDEYTVTTKFVPERAVSRQNAGASALANMAGLNLGSAMTTEAIYPDMYPEIITSNPFVTDLFAVPVGYRTRNQIDSTDFYSYMRDTYRLPWWINAKRLPGRFKRWVRSLFKGKTESVVGYENLDLSRLTSEQSRVAGLIRKTLALKTDKSTSVISLSVSSQDPRVATCIADEVVTRLKQYVTDYRTEKARKNLDYYQKLYDEYRQIYFTSQQRYANYVDSHQGIVLERVRTEQMRLQNEMNLNYQLYNSCAQQLQAAQAKVQEETPVFTMINPPAVPLRPAGPSRMLIIVALAILGAFLACFWILVGQGWIQELRQDEDVKPAQPEERP